MNPWSRLLFLVVVFAAGSIGLLAALSGESGADPAIDSEEADFLVRINQYRAENGLGPLALNTDLSEASDWMSNDMATDNYFPLDHIDNESPPRNPTQRANAFGYNAGAGENIAAGTSRATGEAAFIAWKNSPPHNANMLNANYTVIGIARVFNANAQYGWYWTTNFGIVPNPAPATPTQTAGQTAPPTPTPSPSPSPTPVPTGGAQGPIENLIGCGENSLAATDDGSAPAFTTSFPLNFFGQTYSTVYVNNNGNVTFDGQLGTYTPFGLQGTSQKIIAPFFADVDTQGTGSGIVKYGNAVYSGNRAFCVNWINVGYFNDGTDKLNSFQLLLVERADQGAGDFDIMMNFAKVQWETGNASGGSGGLGGNSAHMGYSNGVNESFEYPGSGVPGSFLDSNPNGLIHGSENSLKAGRYVYFVRNGAPTTGGTISGKVYGGSVAPGNEMRNGPIQICGAPGCFTAQTNDAGEFVIRGLEAATYGLRVFPGNDVQLVPSDFGPYNMPQDGTISGLELVLPRALVPPANTTITSRATNGNVPVVYWAEPLALRTTGCEGGSASYEISQGGNVFRSGQMAEGPAGQYTATVDPLAPVHGQGLVHIVVNCPSGPPQVTDFNIYIDPSGNVRTVEGEPIDGAKVTLYRSETPNGPFTVVPNGSTIMSPANRTNPDITDGAGHFGWDVIAGYYKVRAEKPGCASPEDAGQPYAETEVLEIPPPVTDLDIRLDCPSGAWHFPKGDVGCDGTATVVDALQLFRYAAGFPIEQGDDCPTIGDPVAGTGLPNSGTIVGDIDCDGDVDEQDGLALLRAVGDVEVALPAGCELVIG